MQFLLAGLVLFLSAQHDVGQDAKDQGAGNGGDGNGVPLTQRNGQGQTADTVVIHHIIAKDTIDERIMAALRKKEKAQTALIDAVKANLEG